MGNNKPAMRSRILRLGHTWLLHRNLPEIQRFSVRFSSSEGPLKTCLYDFHVASGGKMVDFAGYSMSVQYSSMGIPASHKHTRTHCSIFDVSHMLQTRVHGEDRFEFIESLTVADARNLQPNQGALTLFTNDEGGIIDDLIVTNAEEHLYVVSNAGCRDKDVPLMSSMEKEMNDSGKDVTTTPIEASLAWTIPKSRRATGGFPGSDVILKQIREGVGRKRVGFLSKGPPARGHTVILDS